MQRLETPLTDADIDRLDELLSSIHEPLQPMDASAVDGYLCGVLLQPVTILWADVLPALFDADARSAVPPGVPAAVVDEVSTLAQRRHAELAAAIAARRWFDPWIFEPDDDDDDDEDTPSAAQLLWVSGFSIALERWPQLLKLSNPALQEPLAVLFASVHPDDLEDADDLLPLIETLEPPSTLEEAAEDLVRSVLLLADVSRPLPRAAKGAPRRGGAAGGGAEGGAGGGAGRGAGGPPSGLKRTAVARRHPGPGPRSQKGRRG